MKQFILAFLICAYDQVLGQNFDRNLVGVAYGPYTDHDPERAWNQYSVDDIKAQLSQANQYFSEISTYGMGVNGWCVNNGWDTCDSSALVARAAAELRQGLRVNIGTHQSEFLNQEVANAFAAADDANSRADGTVWGVTITNEYITTDARGQQVLDLINGNRDNAHSRGLQIGVRDTCGAVLGGEAQQKMFDIIRASDFIYCNFYPSREDAAPGPEHAAQKVGDFFHYVRSQILNVNPNINVMIGETGWPSEGESFNSDASQNTRDNLVRYWSAMADWARSNGVKVQMFEAFDEPYKKRISGYEGEAHYGWWAKPDNQQNYFEQKRDQ